MSSRESAETSSLFPLSGVKERMKEKKNGVLKTAKLNASLASKIRTKTINNSSIIKVSLQQNNKALALALNAAKIATQRLTGDKMLLQKEVELCHFENASLRQKLLSVNKYIGELQQLLNTRLQTAFKLSRPSENGSCSFSGNAKEDSRIDDTLENGDDDNRPIRVVPVSLRIPLTHVHDEENDNIRAVRTGNSAGLQMLPLDIPASASNESLKCIPTASAAPKTLPSFCLPNEPLPSSISGGQKLSEVDASVLKHDLGSVLEGNILKVPQNSKNNSLDGVNNNPPLLSNEKTVPKILSSDSMFCGNVTKRKKRRTASSEAPAVNSLTEPSDNESPDSLQLTKEVETTPKEFLEVSQVGELAILNSKDTSCGRVKASAAKGVTRVSDGASFRDSLLKQSNQYSDNNDNGRADATAPSKNNESKNSKIIPKLAHGGKNSNQVTSPDETVYYKERQSSQPNGKARNCRMTFVVDHAPTNLVDNCNPLTSESKKNTFLEKMKNFESHFQNPDTSSLTCSVPKEEEWSTKAVECVFQSSKKIKSQSYVVDPVLPDDQSGYVPLKDIAKKKTYLEDLDNVGDWFKSSDFSSLSYKAPQHVISTEQLLDCQKQISSQEAVCDLNVKRKKTKRKTQEIEVLPGVGEKERQKLDVNGRSCIQPEASKSKKERKGKTANAGDLVQKDHHRTDTDALDKNEKTQKASKRKGTSFSAFPGCLEDEGTFLESIHKNSNKMTQMVHGASTSKNSSSTNKMRSSSSENANWTSSNHVTDLKKQKGSDVKRRTYDVGHIAEDMSVSDSVLQNLEECKTSQAEPTICRTQQIVSLQDIVEPLPLVDSEVTASSPVDHSKTSPGFCTSGYSRSVHQGAKRQLRPEGVCSLPKDVTTLNKNVDQQMASDSNEKKKRKTPETKLGSTAPQSKENNILKDLTNASPSFCNFVPVEASPGRPRRRTHKNISYVEPKINRKLRRGDPFTDSDFLSSPVYKPKGKKLPKGPGKSRKNSRKSKEIKEENHFSELMPVT